MGASGQSKRHWQPSEDAAETQRGGSCAAASRANMPSERLMLCCTGLSAEQKERVSQAASDLGVLVSADLTSECTHLVADGVKGPKYRTATGMRIPVVLPAWLDTCSRQRRLVSEQDYLLPPLHNLTIVLSGRAFDLQAREQVQADVEREGGNYSQDLIEATTHLVTSAGDGPKYEACRTERGLRDVKIVSPAWLAACIRQGVCVEESFFEVKRGVVIDQQQAAGDGGHPLDELYLRSCVLFIPPKACKQECAQPASNRLAPRRERAAGDADAPRAPRAVAGSWTRWWPRCARAAVRASRTTRRG